MKRFAIILLSILFPYLLFSQTIEIKQDYFQQGLTALNKGDTVKAVDLFKDSGKRENNAEAYYKLAEIYSRTKTHTELTKALQAVRKATEIDKKNIMYRLLMAKTREELYYAHKLNIDERNTAIDDYGRILEIDSTCAEANYQLGRLNVEDFLEYNRSGIIDLVATFNSGRLGSYALLPLFKRIGMQFRKSSTGLKAAEEFNFSNSTRLEYSDFVGESFNEAEKLLLRAIRYEPKNKESYLLLSKLYLESNKIERGIEILEILRKINPHDRDVNLFLGLFNYRIGNNSEADKFYKKTFAEMSYEEKELFLYRTVQILLEPELGDKMEIMSREELENKIKKMWLVQDPLLLTPYNERLLEHYSRVAYSNLFFSVKELNIDGWQTDRGEIFIRYGQPLTVRRYRPGQDIILDKKDVTTIRGKTKTSIMRQLIFPKGEIWKYLDKQFSFDDIYSTGNYRFNKYGREGNIVSSFPIDTDDFIHYYRKESPQEYIPRMEGPVFDVNYQTYQFNSDKKNKTKVYLSYSIVFDSLLAPMESFSEGYEMGIFFHDLYMNKQLDKKVNHAIVSHNNEINSVDFDLIAEPGNLAFEIIRNKDKGTASYHGKFKINDFSTKELKLSSLVLANEIDEESICEECIQRNEINIQPNPEQTFSKEKQLYLYYEVYNLTKGKDNLTDFEQKITIQKKEEDNILTDVLDVVGLGSKGEKISTTSNYQTLETDPQIYFQLDLSKYEPGDYVISLGVKDILANSETVSSTNVLLIE